MATNKTQKTSADVETFLASVDNDTRREDAQYLCALLRRITGEAPAMWGESIIGFGEYHYEYASGREGDFLRVGFSPRKKNLVVYFMNGFDDQVDLLEKLGPHKSSVSCLYLTRLERIDEDVLVEMLNRSWAASPMGESTD